MLRYPQPRAEGLHFLRAAMRLGRPGVRLPRAHPLLLGVLLQRQSFGYIRSYTVHRLPNNRAAVYVSFAYHANVNARQGLSVLSTPVAPLRRSAAALPVYMQMGHLRILTTHGVLTHTECTKRHRGGIVLARVW